MAKCVAPALKLPCLIPDRLSILSLTPWSTVLLGWLKIPNHSWNLKFFLHKHHHWNLLSALLTPSHPIYIFRSSYSSNNFKFSNGKFYAFLSSFMCALFPHPLFICLECIITRSSTLCKFLQAAVASTHFKPNTLFLQCNRTNFIPKQNYM